MTTLFVGERPTRLGLLYNPHSGTNRRRPTDLPAAVAALDHFASQAVDLVAISGGDGTVQMTLTALWSRPAMTLRPQLAVFAAGTTNMTASDVGHPGDQVWALRQLAHWLRTGVGRVARVKRSVLQLAVPGHALQCGMFVGAGLISRGVGFYREDLHDRGLAGLPGILLTLGRGLGAAARSGARHLLRLLPVLVRGRSHPLGTEANGYFAGGATEIRLFLDSPLALDGELFTPVSATEPTVVRAAGRAIFLRVDG